MWEGLDPTLIVSTTARVAVSITETLSEPECVT